MSYRILNTLAAADENCTAHGIRVSGVKHISLRRNRVTALGAVALAVMMRDYSIASDTSANLSSSTSTRPPLSSSVNRSPIHNGDLHLPSLPPKNGIDPPSPTPDRMRRSPQLSPSQDDIDEDASFGAERKTLLGERWQPSEVRSRLQKQIDSMPRVGSLLTLDIKGNDIRVRSPLCFLCDGRS